MKLLAALSISLSFLATSLASAQTDGVPSVVLDAGNYVVTFARQEPCVTTELNLSKELRFNLAADAMPEVLVKSAGPVLDNLVRPALCMLDPLPSKGTLYITLAQTSKVEGLDELGIVSVDKVLATRALTRLPAALGRGDYIVQLEGLGGCYDHEVNVAKSLEYRGNLPVITRLEGTGTVVDDLIRPMVCRRFSLASAEVYVQASSRTLISADRSGALKVKSVRQVTATESVSID